MNNWYYFKLAAKAAVNKKRDRRKYRLGAIGIRNDGTIVCSRNLSCKHQRAESHAEFRLSRKLDKGATVYVARVDAIGRFLNSKPCGRCQMALRSAKRIYYTISDNNYGVIE